jgi:hypothetical protein
MQICLSTSNTLRYPQGGVLWVFLNWAFGLRALGHEVIWFDVNDPKCTDDQTRDQIQTLKSRLKPYGFAQSIAIATRDGRDLPAEVALGCVSVEQILESDLLIDFRYDLSPDFVRKFKRSAFMDIDPGILQINIAKGYLPVPAHQVCFTIGETVGRAGSRFPDVGREWMYTPPCVALDQWPACPPVPTAPFTTVSHWYMDEWIVEADGSYFKNDKRSGFLPFLDLPRKVSQPLELALCLAGEAAEYQMLRDKGWRVRESHEVTPTAEAFQDYVQQSGGEFGCAKPAYVKYHTAWLSDRTLCYLASGRPCVVQNTGPSKILPNTGGIFRFDTLDEAVEAFELIQSDYGKQSRLARKLAEEFFDAKNVAGKLLSRAMG